MLLVLLNELKNCYENAIIQNNQNLKTATIILTSSENENCEKFQDEVKLDIYFHGGFQTVSYIYDAFNYTSTEQIIMQNITITNKKDDGLELPLFAKLNISSLSYWTVVRVSYFGNQLSQMDQCFDVSKSTFQILQQNFEFYIFLTQACLNEITVLAYQFQYQFGTKAETIEIFRKDKFPDDYNCEIINGTVMKCNVVQNFISDIQTPFLQPVVDFSIKSSGVEYKTQIKFQDVIIGTVQDLLVGITTQFYKDVFYVDFQLSDDENLRQTWLNLISGCNLVIYRLTVKFDGKQEQFQFEFADFQFTRLILTRGCGGDEECLALLSQINSMSQEAQFYFDITSFRGDELAGTTGIEFKARISCFRRVVIKIRDSKNVCFQLEKSAFFMYGAHCQQIKDGVLSTIQVTAINSSDIYQKCFSGQTVVKFKFDEPEVCYQCDDCTNQIDNLVRDDMFVFLSIIQNGQRSTTLGYQWQYDNYDTVTVLVSVLASIIIALALADTIYKMIIFLRITKSYKKKR